MSSNTLLKIIKAGIFALLLTPVIVNKDFYFPFIGPKSLYFMAIVEVIFFLWVILVWKWKQYRPNFKNPLVIAVLAFLAISFIAAIFGANFSVSFWSKFERMGGVLMLAHLAALVVVASSVLKGKDWNWLLGASVIVAAVVAVEALFDRSIAAGNGGFLGNDSFWGVYILFNVFFALYLFFSKEWRDSDRNWLLGAGLAVPLLAAFETISGSGNAISWSALGSGYFWGVYILFNSFLAFYFFFFKKWDNVKKLRIFASSAFIFLSLCLLLEGTPLWLNLPIFHAGQIGQNIIPSSGFVNDIINSGARAAKVSLIAGLLFAGILWAATRKNTAMKFGGRAVLIAAVVGGLSIIVFSVLPGNSVYRMMQSRFGEGTIHGRVVVWQIAWKGFLERPLFGWGPENFDLAFTKYYNPCLGTDKCAGEIWYDRAHNILFDVLVTTGIAGLIGYLSLFGAALWMLWKKYRDGIIGFAVVAVFTAMFAAYFLQNLTVFDTVDSYLMFFLSLGFVASLSSPGKVVPVKALKEKVSNFFNGGERRLRWYEWTGLGIAFFICFNNFIIGPIMTDYLAVATVKTKSLQTDKGQIIKQEDKPFGSDERKESYQKTFLASPMGKYQISEFFGQVCLEALQDKTRTIPEDQQVKEFEFLTDLQNQNIRENPLDYKAHIVLGGLYTFWGLIDNSKFALAESTLQDTIKMAPNDQEGYWNLAQTKLFEMRIDDALSLAHQALDLEPDHPKSQTMIYQIENIKKKIGDKLPGSISNP